MSKEHEPVAPVTPRLDTILEDIRQKLGTLGEEELAQLGEMKLVAARKATGDGAAAPDFAACWEIVEPCPSSR